MKQEIEPSSEIEINEECPCTEKNCPRHGVCKECQAYHHEQGEETFCGK